MESAFSSIKHFFGKVALGLVAIVHKTAQAADASEPVIASLLTEGASVASLIPGIGPEVASLLNAGVQLLGDAKAAIDQTDAVCALAVTQAAALAPSGYSFILIKQDVLDDVKTLLSGYEAEITAAKATVATVHPPATPTIQSPASLALATPAPAEPVADATGDPNPPTA
jgi:hypothetical protein